MKKKIFFELLIGIGGFLLLWYGMSNLKCSSSFKMPTLSVEKQEKFGEKLIDYIKQENPEVKNTFVNDSLSKIKNRLVKNIKNSKYNYKIIVLKSSTINAFALPGGYIVIFSGLIQFTQSPEELASIIAHEMGHVEKEHVMQKLYLELGMKVASIIITGNDSTVLDEVRKVMTKSIFSKSKEQEADEFGLKLLEKSSIDPRIMAKFFRRLKNKYKNHFWINDIFGTHPSTTSRYKNSLSYSLKKNFKKKKININWKKLKKVLKKNEQQL